MFLKPFFLLSFFFFHLLFFILFFIRLLIFLFRFLVLSTVESISSQAVNVPLPVVSCHSFFNSLFFLSRFFLLFRLPFVCSFPQIVADFSFLFLHFSFLSHVINVPSAVVSSQFFLSFFLFLFTSLSSFFIFLIFLSILFTEELISSRAIY